MLYVLQTLIYRRVLATTMCKAGPKCSNKNLFMGSIGVQSCQERVIHNEENRVSILETLPDPDPKSRFSAEEVLTRQIHTYGTYSRTPL